MSGQGGHSPQRQQQQQQQQRVTHKPAQAVQYACRLLRSHGVDQLTPELLRQAKFDAAASAQPLLLALHDLAVLQLAGFPPKSAKALHRLRRQLQQEALQDAAPALPPAGRLLLLHCLTVWGCPTGVVAQLTLPQPSSRATLLALCWLLAHTRLFDRAWQQLQLPADLLPLLPPYPEDTCLTAAAQGQAQAAAAACKQHHQRVQQLLQQQQQQVTAAGGHGPSSSNGSGGCWLAVQTAAQHVLSTYRAATLRLQQLTCLVEAREKLLHELKREQQQQGQQRQQRQRPDSTPGLTAFELHLLANPPLLQQHREALAQAVSLLQQQQECRQHAGVFFAWAASIVSEAHQQQLQQQGGTVAVSGSNGSVTGGSVSAAAGRQQPPTHAATAPLQQQQQQVLPVPRLQELLPLVQQLPPARDKLAAGVLTRVQKQLQQAASDAGIPVSSIDSPAGKAPQPQAAPASTAGGAADQLAAAVAGTCSLGSTQDRSLHPGASRQQQHTVLTAAFDQAAVAAMLRAGTVPQACLQQLQQLPQDIQDALQQQQQEHQQALQTRAQQELAQHQSSSVRRLLVQHPSQQQQQQQAGASLSSSLRGHGSPPPANQPSGAVVAAQDELQRLTDVALQVAKQLAKARAANKQQLGLAAQALLESACEQQGQQLVLYQS